MSIIKPRDFDTTPTEYANYLQEQIQWANGILNRDAVQWPTGDSHAIARGVANDARSAYADLILDFGRFYADGTLAGFRD